MLRGSRLWAFRLKRCALPLEHFEAQGYVIFEDDTDPCKCQYLDFLRTLSDSKVRALASTIFWKSHCMGGPKAASKQ